LAQGVFDLIVEQVIPITVSKREQGIENPCVDESIQALAHRFGKTKTIQNHGSHAFSNRNRALPSSWGISVSTSASNPSSSTIPAMKPR
jgi:hypothetical protein